MNKQGKLLICVLAVALVVAFMPTVAFAAGTSKDVVEVVFTAGTPGAYDVPTDVLTAKGNLAETYFPEIRDNEPAGVSFADALVQAHIKKYGKDKVKNYLTMVNGEMGTEVKKQFGHKLVGVYYSDGKYVKGNVSDAVRQDDVLYVGSFKNSKFSDLYGRLGASFIETTSGRKVTVKVSADNWGKRVVPVRAGIVVVDYDTGKVVDLKSSYNRGKATATFTCDMEAGTYYIAPVGKVKYRGNDGTAKEGEIMGDVSMLTVNVPQVKGVKLKTQKGRKIKVDWKAVKDADGYRLGYKVKGAREFRYKNISKSQKSYTLRKLKEGKRYVISLQAYEKAGKEKYMSKAVTRTSGKVID